MLILAAILAVFIGIAVGLLGGGGSILTTPMLKYVLGFTAQEAIAASLLVVAVTSLFGLLYHARAKRVRWKTGLIFGGASMVGAFAGGQVGSRLPGVVLLTAFAFMMAATAIAMVRGRKEVAGPAHQGLPIFRVLLDGAVVGFVTGLVGAGGGFLVVPALVLLGGLPMQAAVGTSLLVVMMKSFAGFLGYMVKFGNGSFISWNTSISIPWGITITITVMAIVGSLIGAALAGRIHPDRLRKGFGWFVLVMAIFILAQEIGSTVWEFAQGSVWHGIGVVALMVGVIALVVFIIRLPVKVPIGDFDTTGAMPARTRDDSS